MRFYTQINYHATYVDAHRYILSAFVVSIAISIAYECNTRLEIEQQYMSVYMHMRIKFYLLRTVVSIV